MADALTTTDVAALTTTDVAALTTTDVAALKVVPGVILPGEKTEVWTTFDRVAGNIISGVALTLPDGRCFVSGGDGHVTLPEDVPFECGYYAERSR